MKKIKKIISANAVFFIALLASVISMIFVPPNANYIGYIDYNVIIMLFCLMGVVAAFRSAGIFDVITGFLLRKTVSARMIAFVLMNLCFFSSMLVTNDVALITFVPLTIGLASLTDDRFFLIKTLIIETAAANLGSMMTPLGNPQNLYIYSHYNLSAIDFITTLLPLGILSYILLTISVLLIKKGRINFENHRNSSLPKIPVAVYSVLFLICVLSVAGIVNKYVCLAVTTAGLLIFCRKAFLKIDYMLLATFVCFFVFVGNISEIDSINNFISEILVGSETLFSALISQVISNVPAAVMLSEFTDNACGLLAGVNIGGLGTPVASLASLITYRYYCATEKSQNGKFILIFLIYNFALFALVLGAEMIIQNI
ncbi:MAG: citrate transporter [Oscillospiraceae bacterium]|nr:citrate transporter [Oscillospiraceae bacterium]